MPGAQNMLLQIAALQNIARYKDVIQGAVAVANVPAQVPLQIVVSQNAVLQKESLKSRSAGYRFKGYCFIEKLLRP